MPVPQNDTCVLYAKTVQASIVKSLFECLKDVTFEWSFTISKEGIRPTSIDASKSSLAFVKLDAENFDTFVCARDSMSIGIPTQILHKRLKTITTVDILTLFIESRDTEHLGIVIENQEKKMTTIFKLKLLDIDHKDITIPDIEFDRVARLPSATFQRLCRDMSQLVSSVEICSTPTQLSMVAVGDFVSQETLLREMSFRSNTV